MQDNATNPLVLRGLPGFYPAVHPAGISLPLAPALGPDTLVCAGTLADILGVDVLGLRYFAQAGGGHDDALPPKQPRL